MQPSKLLPTIAQGRAVFIRGELRCAAPRPSENLRCNKLIAKLNTFGMIAGDFLCERCKEKIEVRLVPAGQAALTLPSYPGGDLKPRFGETPIQNQQEVSPL